MQGSSNPRPEDSKLAPHPVLSEYYADEKDRRERVDQMFNASAEHYDWICNVMSFGSGGYYRRDALIRAGLKPGMKLLDVGAGTGEISLLAQKIVGDNGSVVALDPSKGMLSEAKKLGVKKTTLGLGEALPFPDNSFDILTMGFALRHVSDLEQTFTEYRRVIKPGGKILLLEISRPEGYWTTLLLKMYMKGIVPLITRIFRRSANAQELMRYYWDTIEQCVRPDIIVGKLQDIGIENAERHTVMGIFSEYSGTK